MWWMGIIYPPYIASLAICFWLLAREDLLKTARASGGLKATIYRFLALEGAQAYLYRLTWPKELEDRIYRILPLKRMGLSLDSDDADVILNRGYHAGAGGSVRAEIV